MPSSFTEMLIVAACLLSVAALGLPAVIRALGLLKQRLSFHQDEATNDEWLVA